MSFTARDKALSNFADNSDVTVLLASLRCGGCKYLSLHLANLSADDGVVGLNLTMASKVIMIDPWWNSASEQQAFCRVFRIGQKEETYMSRLCVRNTVDERLVEMQNQKQKEIDEVMEDKGKRTQKYVCSCHTSLRHELTIWQDDPPRSHASFRQSGRGCAGQAVHLGR